MDKNKQSIIDHFMDDFLNSNKTFKIDPFYSFNEHKLLADL